ncbi:MAG: hypothetical protein KJZ86_13985 [Caldilineaceae bacterium]|nr:hypothetical protein [Caldilineaceae bacterium]
MNASRQIAPPPPSPSIPSPALANGPALAREIENPLSEREMDVARLLTTGASNSDIAAELIISPHTVKVHLRNIYEKLEVSSRTEASMLLVSQGWIRVPGIETIPLADEDEIPEPLPLTAISGQPFYWQRIYLLAVFVVSLGLLLTPFLTRRVESLPNLLSDGDAMALGRPVIAELPRWESRTPLRKGRSRLALAAFQDTALYAVGGEASQGQPIRDVDLYDLRVNEWRSAAPLPLPLANAAIVVDQSHIVVAGGVTTVDGSLVISDELLLYWPEQDRWAVAGRLPVPLAGASLTLAGDSLYLAGGWDGEAARSEIWRLPGHRQADVQPDEWQLIARMEEGRAFAGAVIVNDELYIVGGYDGRRELRTAWAYDLFDNSWRKLPDMAAARGGITLLYDGLAIFAVGGGWSQPVNTIERFDPATGLWSNFPAPISGEWRHLGGVASAQGHLYLVGGWSGSYLDVHLRYQSSFRTFFPSTQKNDGPTTAP